MEPLFVCLLVYFNTSCFPTGWSQEEILLLYIIQDLLGKKDDASPAPLQHFGTANHGQRQNESILLYQLSPMTEGKASGAASKSILAGVLPAKCPLCNPLAHGCQHLILIQWVQPMPAQRWDLGLGDPPEPQILSFLHTFSCFQQLFQKLRAAVMCFTAPQSVRRSDKIFL